MTGNPDADMITMKKVLAIEFRAWPPSTDDVSVAKFVATTILTGVPAIGADFSGAPATQSAIVKASLTFYKANRDDLTQRTFRPICDFVVPDQKIESARSAFIYLRSGSTTDIAIDGDAPTIYIANCTDSDLDSLRLAEVGTGDYQVEVLDPCLKEISPNQFRRTMHFRSASQFPKEACSN